jgi:hypothetical protein
VNNPTEEKLNTNARRKCDGSQAVHIFCCRSLLSGYEVEFRTISQPSAFHQDIIRHRDFRVGIVSSQKDVRPRAHCPEDEGESPETFKSVRSGASNKDTQMTSTIRDGRYVAARTAAFAALLILAACGGGGGGSGPTYPVGGSVSGLAGSGLVLTAGAGNSVSVSKAGVFTFPTLLGAGASYDITVASPPANPSQTCTVSNGTGTVSGALDNIMVVCVVSQFTVGGSISGLVGTRMILRDNSGDDLPVSSNGAFVFTVPVASGGAYSVSVVTQPSNPTQNCVLLAGSAVGTVTSGNITGVSVVCPSAGRFAYVTDEQSNQIFGFTIDGSSGALTPMPTSPFCSPHVSRIHGGRPVKPILVRIELGCEQHDGCHPRLQHQSIDRRTDRDSGLSVSSY